MISNSEPHKRHALKIIDALLQVAFSNDATHSATVTQKELAKLRSLFERMEKELQEHKKDRRDAWDRQWDENRKRLLCHTERDEARRMYCLAMRSPAESERQIAARMKWDCFGDQD